MHPITSDSISRIRLGRAQTSMFYAVRGTAIVALQGNILITQTDGYLADITVGAHALISEGDCHVIQHGGWIRLQASGIEAAAGLVIAEAKAGVFSTSFWQRWRRWVNALMPLKG
jgi:hypothetical protein